MREFKTTFRTYKRGTKIGEGGCGTVYRATAGDDEYAVKVLDPQKANAERRKRFKNELNFCASHDHANIVRVVDNGLLPETDSPFYVMPLYSETLRGLMANGLEPDETVALMNQMLDGVEAAHLRGVWHRDLKPENLLYDASTDTLVVADFGIAHFSQELLHTAVETKARSRLANFRYAAPEQRERGRAVDQRADIFALGLIINEMFTGEVIQGTKSRQISAASTEHGYLDAIVEMMVRQAPEDRPESLDEVKKRLIAHRTEHVTRQRLATTRDRVVKEGELDDPILNHPIELIRVDYHDGFLHLELDQAPTPLWTEVFRNMPYRTALYGKEPGRFNFTGAIATIPAKPAEAQTIVDHFKNYLDMARGAYEQRVNEREAERIQREREEIQRQQREEETRLSVLENLRI